jgi:methanethiol S-methyltransferase
MGNGLRFSEVLNLTFLQHGIIMNLVLMGLAASLWCIFHSFFISHLWRNFVANSFPRYQAFSRIVYVLFSSGTLGWLLLWNRSLPHEMLWDWPGLWILIRWAGLALAAVLFVLGARSFDNRAFLGLRQMVDYFRGADHSHPPFKTEGILEYIRHPWYSGTLLFLVFCLPITDVNLVWRGVFLVYTLIGTELEERKMVQDLGGVYGEYRKKVPRFFPRVGGKR